MPDVKEIYETITQQAAPAPGALERQRMRQTRHIVNRKLGVFAIAAAFAIVAIVVGTLALREGGSAPADTGLPASERVGFVGLPPEGATPSTPAQGDLVLSLYGRSTTDGRLFRAWVYADGRIVWDQEGNFPYGANERTTGFLEQRLTPPGVELMISEIVSTGLFDDDRTLTADGLLWGIVRTPNGDRPVTVRWYGADVFDRPPWDASRYPARASTPKQLSALQRLDGLLTHPASWLPANAWADQDIEAYVPSRFAVCVEAVHGGIEASRILDLLPGPTQALLRQLNHADDGSNRNCVEATTDQARAVAQTLDEAGLELDARGSAYRLEYRFEPSVPLEPGPIENTVVIFFEPFLPHGDFLECSPCR